MHVYDKFFPTYMPSYLRNVIVVPKCLCINNSIYIKGHDDYFHELPNSYLMHKSTCSCIAIAIATKYSFCLTCKELYTLFQRFFSERIYTYEYIMYTFWEGRHLLNSHISLCFAFKLFAKWITFGGDAILLWRRCCIIAGGKRAIIIKPTANTLIVPRIVIVAHLPWISWMWGANISFFSG